VPERGRLGLLQVGLVRHPGLYLPAGGIGDGGSELRRIPGELGDLPAQYQPQRDPGRLPARPAGVQPAGIVAEAFGEPALPAVVDLAVLRVVRKLLGRDLQRVQHSAEQPAYRLFLDHLASPQVE
jgi:hypothetical protein